MRVDNGEARPSEIALTKALGITGTKDTQGAIGRPIAVEEALNGRPGHANFLLLSLGLHGGWISWTN